MTFDLCGHALLGLVLMLRERTALAGALGMWSLGLATTIVLSFNTSRYRAPLVFFGCVWAAYALARAWRLWRDGRRRRLAAGTGIVLGLAVSIGLIAEPQRDYPLPLEWEESVALSSLGQPDRRLRQLDGIRRGTLRRTYLGAWLLILERDQTRVLHELGARGDDRHRPGGRGAQAASAAIRTGAGQIRSQDALAATAHYRRSPRPLAV